MNIIITGTSSGLGEALAKIYLEKGDTVYGISRKSSVQLQNYSGYHHLNLDLTFYDDLIEKLPVFIGNVKSFDLVILNAGILPEIKDMTDTSISEISSVMRVNVWANKAIIDTLFKSELKVQQVVAISSGAAVSGARGWNAYAISKAALNMMMSLYSKEIPETHFSALAPGVVDTGMQEYIYGLPEEKNYPVIKRLKEMRDNGEMLSPLEAAKNLMQVIPGLRRYESGAFLDIRDL